jgi:IS30 family transposase
MRVIAQGLSRALSTVSREIAHHGGRAQYRANEADQQAWASALRPRPCLLATHSKLQEIVAGKLMQDWSPKQISGWLKQHYPYTHNRACGKYISRCATRLEASEGNGRRSCSPCAYRNNAGDDNCDGNVGGRGC